MFKGISSWIGLAIAGMFGGAVAGFLIGAWIGSIATRGCEEMDCLDGLGYSFLGMLLGALLLGIAGWLWGKRRFNRERAEARQHDPGP